MLLLLKIKKKKPTLFGGKGISTSELKLIAEYLLKPLFWGPVHVHFVCTLVQVLQFYIFINDQHSQVKLILLQGIVINCLGYIQAYSNCQAYIIFRLKCFLVISVQFYISCIQLESFLCYLYGRYSVKLQYIVHNLSIANQGRQIQVKFIGRSYVQSCNKINILVQFKT